MSAKTIRIPAELLSLNSSLKQLHQNPSFQVAQQTINELVALLGVKANASDWSLINDSRGKIKANASWFEVAEGFGDRRATYKLAENNEKNIDFKAFWVQKTIKSTISWAVALTPNFEDEPYNVNKNIGIDFFIPKKADRIIVTLSKDYIIRTLELSGELSPTQQNILIKWAQPFDFSNKAQVHEILWDSFDLEPVNKEFYKEISSYFVELKQYLSGLDLFDEQHAAYFTSRLIGRLIFCWFIDKKGFINPDIKYFETEGVDSNQYYHAKLEKLFFATLNTPVEDRGVKWESVQKSLFPSDTNGDLFNFNVDTVTPFLNGGLFEERQSDHVGNKNLTFPTDFFNRLIKTLNHYNFTTDESTSSFQQVAIDPEMLGRIFENLLAEQSEETGEQARKAKGAFYTPREIVDYMSRESLREYLKTKVPEDEMRDYRLGLLLDKKPHEFKDQQSNYRRDLKPYKSWIIQALDELKVLDPACGSGAFPMGMLQLLVQVYERLEPRFDPYETKVSIVKNNIFGVDIEPMAVEISRLRTWLSIIVDEEVESNKVKPLPNLDFKFVCANTLIPLDREGSQQLMDNPNLENELLEIRDKYFNARTHKSKQNLRDKFNKLIGHTGNGKQQSLLLKSQKQKQLESYKPFEPENSADFFDSEFMFGQKKFDVVIGNPPYVEHKKLKHISRQLKDIYKLYTGSSDLSTYFFEFALNNLQKDGLLCYINTNKFFNTNYGKLLRKLLLEKNILTLINFEQVSVFDNVLVSSCVLLVKNKHFNNKSFKFKQYIKTNNWKDFSNGSYEEYKFEYLDELEWSFKTEEEILLRNKIENDTSGLDTLEGIEIRRGITTGFDPAFIINTEIKNKFSKIDIIEPLIKGEHIKKFDILDSDLWLINSHNGIKDQNIKPIDLPAYEDIYSFLQKTNLNNDNKVKLRSDQGENWYNLRNCAFLSSFYKTKIVWPLTADKWGFALDTDKKFLSSGAFFLTSSSESLFYILGILNSKLMEYYFSNIGVMTAGGAFTLKKSTIGRLPIKKSIKQSKKEEIEKIVKLILSDKNHDLVPKLDKLIFELYDLNKVEVELIESKLNEG